MLCEIGIELGYCFPDANQTLKCPIDGTDALKQSQMANRTSADAAMRCPRTRKLRQSVVPREKNCIKKTASEKKSLKPSRRTNDRESRCVMGHSISEMGNAVNDVTSLLEKNGKVSDNTIQLDNRTKGNSKMSNGDRLVPLA